MPTYRYSGPHDPEPHQVVADDYERGGDVVTFFNCTSFDGQARASQTLGVIATGDVVELAD
jgi:hypothetical protein